MEAAPIFKVIIDENLLRDLAKEEVKRIFGDGESSTWWDLKRLESETCRKRDWLIEKILLNPEFKKEMKIISNGRKNGRWMFRATAMREFLDEHFQELNGKQRVKRFKVVQT